MQPQARRPSRLLSPRAGWGSIAAVLLTGAAAAQAPQSLPGLIVTMPSPPPAPQAAPQPPAAKPAQKPVPKPKAAAVAPSPKAAAVPGLGEGARTGSGQTIATVVNGDPITAYEIEQRARLLAMQSNLGERAQENFKRLIQLESTNQRLREILQETIQANPGKSREQVLAIFEERKTQFALSLQKQSVESARASVIPTLRKAALEDLIEELVKLQEAKRVGIVVEESEIETHFKGLAERNKMTPAQFLQHLHSMGIEGATIKARMRAGLV